MNKPREWTVKKDRVLVYEDDNQRNYEVIQIAEGELVNNGEKVKVIEYSALLKLESRIQKLRERIKVECYCRDRHCIWCEALQQDDEASK